MSRPRKKTVGVIVARFQEPELHKGHRFLIETVVRGHQDVLIVLGVAYMSSDLNPLSFEMRKGMVEAAYPNAEIRFIDSETLPSSPKTRSRIIDEAIERAFPGREAMVYGSRESIVHKYVGKFKTVEVPTIYQGSASQIRRNITVRNSSDFRAGVIYGVVKRKPIYYPAIDVAVIDPNRGSVLLVGKHQEEGKLRFPGVFFDPSKGDTSYEAAAERALQKELPKLQVQRPWLIGSCPIDDWRYRGSQDGVISVVTKTNYSGDGNVLEAGEGVDTAAWVRIADVSALLVDDHRPIGELMRNKWFSG